MRADRRGARRAVLVAVLALVASSCAGASRASSPPTTTALPPPVSPTSLVGTVPADEGDATSTPLAIVATDDDFADALTASAAAASRGAPVLLTGRYDLTAATDAALRRTRPEEIFVVGGESAVSDTVVDRLGAIAPGRVARVAGQDRFDTAARLAERLYPGHVSTVYVASGEAFADALAAGPVAGRAGAPILLVAPDHVPSTTADAVRRMQPDEIRILGGSAAVSDDVAAELGGLAPRVTRLGGQDRYATAVELSKSSYPKGAKIAYLATGRDYPDALVGGPLAAADDAPLLLVEPSCVPPVVSDELLRLGRPRVVLLGSSGVLSQRLALGAVCASALPTPSPPTTPPPPPPSPPPRTLPPVTARGLARGAQIGLGQIETYGFSAHIGADLIDANDNKLCSPTPDCTYWGLQNIYGDGRPELGGIPIEIRGVHMARLELYPDLVGNKWDTNDNWDPNLTVGGLHLWDPDGRPVFNLRLPNKANGAVRYFGRVVEQGIPVADGRVRTQVFQVVPKDTTAGAFNISMSRSGLWTGGWLWPGLYELFFFDDATGHAIQTRGVLDMASPITIDVSEPCFGFATCTVLS
jgi:putative cell wall-binding protein